MSSSMMKSFTSSKKKSSSAEADPARTTLTETNHHLSAELTASRESNALLELQIMQLKDIMRTAQQPPPQPAPPSDDESEVPETGSQQNTEGPLGGATTFRAA